MVDLLFTTLLKPNNQDLKNPQVRKHHDARKSLDKNILIGLTAEELNINDLRVKTREFSYSPPEKKNENKE
ncbi:MAG: hypothetical protein ACTSUE_14915 [Promethearchaeota archaeon]